MFIKTGRTFVYGRFTGPGLLKSLGGPPGWDDVTVEILREFGPTEFIGKLYTSGGPTGNWVPLAPGRLGDYEWYRAYLKTRTLFLEMVGSGNWEVGMFRNESDEIGLYVAVALRYYPKNLPKKAEPYVHRER